ncbi:MAG: large subunit ribosomal protein L32 [Candidatus Paceibacteria bacterium]|jgi:large subunit ribosomal protein L32
MVIRMRSTRSHTGNRRSHHALKANTIVTDPDTNTSRLRHRVDMTTGMYRGRQVIDITKLAAKKAKRTQKTS